MVKRKINTGECETDEIIIHFEDDYDFSVAIIGYDETVITNANGVYVGFLSDDMLNAFMAQELPYNQRLHPLPCLSLRSQDSDSQYYCGGR